MKKLTISLLAILIALTFTLAGCNEECAAPSEKQARIIASENARLTEQVEDLQCQLAAKDQFPENQKNLISTIMKMSRDGKMRVDQLEKENAELKKQIEELKK